jgi:hypothetical protein
MSAAFGVDCGAGDSPKGVRRYAVAGLPVLVGIAIQVALAPHPNLTIPLLISLLAVIVTANLAGRAPALLATAASFLVDWYFFAQPRLSFALPNAPDVWRLAAFAAAGTAISLLSHRLSGTRRLPRLALLLASSLFLVIVAALVWFDFTNSRAAESSVEHTYQVLNASQLLFSTIEDVDSRQRGYLLTGEQQFLDRYRELASAEPAALQQLRDLAKDNAAQQARLADLQRLVNARILELEEGISARRNQGMQAGIDAVQAGESAHLMRDIRSVLAALEADEHGLLTQHTHAAVAEAARTRGALTMGAAGLVALLIFAGVVIESDVGKLSASEQILRRHADLLDKTPEPIIVWQLGGVIEYWNHGAEELFGFSCQQAVGRILNELLQPIHPLGISAIEELLVRDGAWIGELVHRIDGREIVVQSRIALVTELNGRKIALQANRDITREKQAREEIQKLNGQLEERVKESSAQLLASDKELEAFAYSVSHDLRAPLRGIDGWSLALLEDYGPALAPEALQYLERVRTESQCLRLLTNDLLTLARLSRVELRHEQVDLTSLARAISGRLREVESKRALDFVIEDGISAAGDSHLLDIALSNLMSNAVKFTAPRSQALIEFGQTKMNEERAFYVRDNGVGFDMAYAGGLFGTFQLSHKYTEFPGTAIGLATAQQVLRRHGGRIWADAQPNQGATFYFTVGTEASG